MVLGGTIDREGSVTGVAVWDGTNESSRTVGLAAYLAVIKVTVVLDDGAGTAVWAGGNA